MYRSWQGGQPPTGAVRPEHGGTVSPHAGSTSRRNLGSTSDPPPEEERTMMKFVRRWGLLSIASILAIVTVSCTSGGTDGGTQEQAAAAPATVEVMLSEFKIDPSTIPVPVGQPIEFSVMNMGQAAHTFAVDVAGKTYVTDQIDPGTTVALKVPALDAGTYAAYCTV